MAISSEITTLLQRIRQGDGAASEQLMHEVYGELRRLAGHYMKGERAGHTLQPTALVHEMYAKLFAEDAGTVEWQNRAHFFAVAARQMRRILVDHARERVADKRGGGAVVVSLDENPGSPSPAAPSQENILAVDLALSELEKQDARASRVVELKFFGGLTDHEAAEVLGIPFATIRRDWEFARAWLFHRLSGAKAAGA